MHVALYEKVWMWLGGCMIVLFVGAIGYGAVAHTLHPPSHVETTDPTALRADARFSNTGVTTRPRRSASTGGCGPGSPWPTSRWP